jgi:hypothetical protein
MDECNYFTHLCALQYKWLNATATGQESTRTQMHWPSLDTHIIDKKKKAWVVPPVFNV